MNQKVFKVGDRVKVKRVGMECVPSKYRYGMLGTIYEITEYSIGVRFDDLVGGHDLGLYGKGCRKGHGWYFSPDELVVMKARAESRGRHA
jgi:hypothetical protein